MKTTEACTMPKEAGLAEVKPCPGFTVHLLDRYHPDGMEARLLRVATSLRDAGYAVEDHGDYLTVGNA